MKSWIIFALTLVAVSMGGLVGLTVAAEPYEGYYLFHGAYPNEEGTPYADEFQGLTHDQNNWFLSSNTHEGESKIPQLWKVPVNYNLRHVTDDQNQYPGVIRRRISETPLAQLGYNHFGDISYYQYKGQGYIIVPMEEETRPYKVPNAVAFFRADDLAYVNKTDMPDLEACKDTTARSLGWIAVDPQGDVYTSGDCVNSIHKYSLNWEALPSQPDKLTHNEFTLLDETGNPLMLGRTQGGVFSESGRLLYILSGSEDTDFKYPNDGISVFDTKTWRRVMQSTNGYGYFNYYYNPGFWSYDEPEGITIWDLDDGRAPGISGQLHVGMLDNEKSADDVTLYHYINTIYVDPSYTGDDPSTGEPHKPFRTVGDANYVAWNGARIKIKAGSYPEALTFSKQIQLLAKDGTAHIGVSGNVSLGASGSVNIYSGGGLRIH